MTRREALLTAAAALLSAAPAAAADEPTLRAVHRLVNGQWVRCRMFDLRAGDTFRLDGIVGDIKAEGDPHREASGIWSISGYCGPQPPESA